MSQKYINKRNLIYIMKTIIIALLLIIPLAYAQEDILSARKTNLDLNANQFISQMNLVISFAQNKSIDVTNLTGIKTNFEAKLNEALIIETIDELKNKEKEMKELANQFKGKSKIIFKDYIIELKDEIYKLKKENKEKFNDKINKLNNERRNMLRIAYNRRIEQIKIKITEENKTGKQSKIQNILLERFEKAKTNLNETDFSGLKSTFDTRDVLIKVKDSIKAAYRFLKQKITIIGEME